jgi:hypothetical protein
MSRWDGLGGVGGAINLVWRKPFAPSKLNGAAELVLAGGRDARAASLQKTACAIVTRHKAHVSLLRHQVAQNASATSSRKEGEAFGGVLAPILVVDVSDSSAVRMGANAQENAKGRQAPLDAWAKANRAAPLADPLGERPMNHPATLRSLETAYAATSAFELLLTSGGDERILPDPISRRNRYGTPPRPRSDEIWFSSSTASAITPRGYAAALNAFARLTARAGAGRIDSGSWFDELRARIARIFCVPGSEVILSASGTETELLAITLAKATLRRPLTNIVVAPDETGSGVVHAASGAHFANSTAFEMDVVKGNRLRGWEHENIAAIGVPIRDNAGRLRDASAVDREICDHVESALHAGRDVLLHVLDRSKTGHCGPTRSAARAIAEAARDRVRVVVDACQLRCPVERIRADLRSGFMVMITGSKFAAGPPFCGALLIPPRHMEGLDGLRPPAGLADYSARFDWPLALRAALDQENFPPINFGVGLRWEAALSEIEAFLETPPSLRIDVLKTFARVVRRHVSARPQLDFLDPYLAQTSDEARSIFPILTSDGDVVDARRIYDALRTPGACEDTASICHVGQPVTVGRRTALRMCASMPIVTMVGERVRQQMDLETAFLPVREDIDRVFRKWDAL